MNMAEPPPARQSAGRGGRQPSDPPPEPSPPDSRTPSPSRTTASGSNLEVIRRALDDLKRFLADKADLGTVIAAVETAIPVLEAAQGSKPHSLPGIEQRLDAIENSLKEVQKDVKIPRSYAASAAAATTLAASPRAPQIAKTLPPRHEREITVKATEAEGRTYAEIVRKINTAAGREAAVAARKLPSGDYAITCKTATEKRMLEANHT